MDKPAPLLDLSQLHWIGGCYTYLDITFIGVGLLGIMLLILWFFFFKKNQKKILPLFTITAILILGYSFEYRYSYTCSRDFPSLDEIDFYLKVFPSSAIPFQSFFR